MLRTKCWDRESGRKTVPSSEDDGGGGHETRLASGCFLKVELTGFADRGDVGFEGGNGGVKDGSKMFGVSKRKDGSAQ